MASKFTELAIDCADPKALARFRCSVLDNEVRDADDDLVTIGSPMAPEGENRLGCSTRMADAQPEGHTRAHGYRAFGGPPSPWIQPLVATLLVAIGVPITACTRGGTAGASVAMLTVLTCRDSFAQSATDPGARSVAGIGSPALSGGFSGDNTRWRSKDGHAYLEWKDPVAVAPDARPYRTITVVSPTSARLLFTSPARWATLSSGPLPVLSRRVRLSACGREYASYFGAIMIRGGGCVTLAVAGPAGKLGTITVPINVSQC